jgi:hypothetical protein
MPNRRSLTREAIERAIRSKLVQELGIEASCVVIPVRLVKRKASPGRANWRLDASGVEASSAAALEKAADFVARTTDLREGSDPFSDAAYKVAMRTREKEARYPSTW